MTFSRKLKKMAPRLNDHVLYEFKRCALEQETPSVCEAAV